MSLVFLVLLASYAYFFEGGGWNQNSRFDLVRALVERGTLRIDAYQQNTGDKSVFAGHYFSDKAPGVSFFAVPFIGVVRWLTNPPDGLLQSATWQDEQLYLATLATAAVPAAWAGVCVLWLSVRLGATESGAVVAALAYGLGTPAWAYAILFQSHALSVSCLMSALLAADMLRDSGSARRRVGLGLVVGLAGGWSALAEYPSAVPAAFIVILACVNARRAADRWPWPAIAAIGAGGLAALAVLLVYNFHAFGSPFQISYAYEADRTLMRSGFFDIGRPRLDVAREILFGSFRGLVPLAPALAVAPLGLWRLLRRPETRTLAIVVAATILFELALNASYSKWEGGWSYGPRLMALAMAYLAIGLAPLWTASQPVARVALLGLVLVGVGQSAVAVSTTAQPPADYKSPMSQLLWPAFSDGQLGLNRQTVLDLRPPGDGGGIRHEQVSRAAWNAGQRVGLSGLASLLPLLAIWIVGGGALAASSVRREARRAHVSS
jgi:hypothetical protein